MQSDDLGLVERLKAGAIVFAGKDLPYASDTMSQAAAAIERLVAERDEAREALRPFAAEKLPSSKATEIAYNEFGLRCLMSPLAIARQRARQALKDAP